MAIEFGSNESAGARPAAKRRKSGGKRNLIIGAIVAAVVVALLVLLFNMRPVIAVNETNRVNKDQYQAVFLTNGQVYFGKIDVINSQYVRITDVYYLQVEQDVQSGEQQTQDQAVSESQLVKLGNELHAPEDEMLINREQVLFWENIKDDGRVVSAIKEFKENGNQPAAGANNDAAAPAQE